MKSQLTALPDTLLSVFQRHFSLYCPVSSWNWIASNKIYSALCGSSQKKSFLILWSSNLFRPLLFQRFGVCLDNFNYIFYFFYNWNTIGKICKWIISVSRLSTHRSLLTILKEMNTWFVTGIKWTLSAFIFYNLF